MKVAAVEIPYLAKGRAAVPLVTDDEKGFTKAIKANLTNVRHFYCWNHTINAAKAWLKCHGAVSGEISVYVCYLRELFHKETKKEYQARLEELSIIWSQAFFKYYNEELNEKVIYNSYKLLQLLFGVVISSNHIIHKSVIESLFEPTISNKYSSSKSNIKQMPI